MKNKGLLSYLDLVELVKNGVITADLDNVNGSSIDVTLGDTVLVEQKYDHRYKIVKLTDKEGSLDLVEFEIGEEGFAMSPGVFLLAHTKEVFNLPDDISAEFKLKSTAARYGLNHHLAGWCDPTWHGSVLTLELKNNTQSHVLVLEEGMKIGQIIFYRHEPVPEEFAYIKKGRYNKTSTVTAGIPLE